jgi:SAM-dependent methyltransferase
VRIHQRQVIADTVASRKAILRSYEKIPADFPDFRQQLGDVPRRAEADCQWDLCESYLRQLRTAEAKPLLSTLVKSVYVKPHRRFASQVILDVVRAGRGKERVEKALCSLVLYIWRSLKVGRSIIRRAWSWQRLPYTSRRVRRLFWNHKSEEAFRTRGFMRTEDYYLIQDKLRSIQPRSVLDIGCGRGRYFPMYDQVERIVAIDISEKALARIPTAYRNDKRFDIKAMPVEELDLDEPVDVVISNMVLAHVPPSLTRKAISRIARVTMEVLLDENVVDEGYYCFVHKYKTLFESEGFKLVECKPLAHGNVLYHFRRGCYLRRSERGVNRSDPGTRG